MESVPLTVGGDWTQNGRMVRDLTAMALPVDALRAGRSVALVGGVVVVVGLIISLLLVTQA